MIPVYRVVLTASGQHVNTTSLTEFPSTTSTIDTFSSGALAQVQYYAFSSQVTNSIPIYRVFNSKNNARIMTPYPAVYTKNGWTVDTPPNSTTQSTTAAPVPFFYAFPNSYFTQSAKTPSFNIAYASAPGYCVSANGLSAANYVSSGANTIGISLDKCSSTNNDQLFVYNTNNQIAFAGAPNICLNSQGGIGASALGQKLVAYDCNDPNSNFSSAGTSVFSLNDGTSSKGCINATGGIASTGLELEDGGCSDPASQFYAQVNTDMTSNKFQLQSQVGSNVCISAKGATAANWVSANPSPIKYVLDTCDSTNEDQLFTYNSNGQLVMAANPKLGPNAGSGIQNGYATSAPIVLYDITDKNSNFGAYGTVVQWNNDGTHPGICMNDDGGKGAVGDTIQTFNCTDPNSQFNRVYVA